MSYRTSRRLSWNATRLLLVALLLAGCGGDSDVANPATPPPATPPPPPPPNPLQAQRSALEALYHATGGDSWKRRDNWLTSSPMDDWFGVSVHGSGRIFSIYLWDNGLTGSIPPDIGELGSLTRLNLGDNQITGSIPPEFFKLSRLEDLTLSGNGLNGSIPPEIGRLEKLAGLRLGDNQFTGSIPAELGDLPLLEVLRLRQNSLSGSIPPEIGGLTALRDLNLGSNDLSGGAPAAIGNLERLIDLDLYENPGLSGLMPRDWLNLKRLESLFVSGTELCAFSDSRFREWMRGIPRVDVNECDVGVVERMALAELFNTTGGDDWENAEGWNTDADLASWHGVTVEDGRVRSLLLANNGLTGPVPPAIVALTELKQLDLRNNDLAGSLPVDIGHLSELATLRLTGNAGLDGLFPLSMVRMGQLDVLQYEGTGLCIPPTRWFKAWVAGVAVAEGSLCEDLQGVTVELPMLYLTQSIQQPDGRVPLVANRDALLRVFPRWTTSRPLRSS